VSDARSLRRPDVVTVTESPAHERIGRLFTPVVRRLDPDEALVSRLERVLCQARMPIRVDRYVSRALGVGVVAGVVSLLLGLGLGLGLGHGPESGLNFGSEFGLRPFAVGLHSPARTLSMLHTKRVPPAVEATVKVGVCGALLATCGFVFGVCGVLARPYARRARRRREIDVVLADAVSYMYALAAGGLDHLDVIEAMATADDAYGEVATEFDRIHRSMTQLGTEYRTAIRRQAAVTPSPALASFLTDFLSVLDSGGQLEPFFDAQTDRHFAAAKQNRQRALETLELFGELYVTVSVFPLLLVVVLVIMAAMGEPTQMLLLLTVYVFIPLVSAGFVVLVSTVTLDDPGTGRLRHDTAGSSPQRASDATASQSASKAHATFETIRHHKRLHRVIDGLKAPHRVLRDRPHYSSILTLPLAAATLALAVNMGVAPLSVDGWIDQPVRATAVWVYAPTYLVLGPLGAFTAWNRRVKRALVDDISAVIRTLAAANETGQTPVEAFQTVAHATSGALAEQCKTVCVKVQYGTRLHTALIELANANPTPRLARSLKLIADAQVASAQIGAVLTTALRAAETHDDLERERRSRTRMQVAVIAVTYLTLLGVMAVLQTQFIGVLSGLTGDTQALSAGGSMATESVNAGVTGGLLSLLFFHAVTIQAVAAGTVSGYVQTGDIRAGIPFVLGYLTLALGVWSVVG